MSYILDALKKAERERDIRQVPTLMAEHESGANPRKLPWIILAALALCIGAAATWTLFLHRAAGPAAPVPAAGEYGRDASGAKTESTSEPSAGATAPASRPLIPSDLPSAKTVENNPRLPLVVERTPGPAQQGDASKDTSTTEISRNQPAQVPAPKRATKSEVSAADESKEKSVSLKEALNGMTMSVLVFDENKADRMVFINGRRYVEGDYVDDTYLIESITLEGAVLTYRGERALLRPKAK
ncbi:MAG TPA: general secretion pathway protein GspB [Acidobacteriota bacterium]|nr:general secretion pathway protein GspB [Acidobacteriota bacterium]